MFILKYHAKGRRTEYLGDKKRVVNKRCAIAFGEGLRDQLKKVACEYCILENITVSDTAEMVYKNSYIRVGKIEW